MNDNQKCPEKYDNCKQPFDEKKPIRVAEQLYCIVLKIVLLIIICWNARRLKPHVNIVKLYGVCVDPAKPMGIVVGMYILTNGGSLQLSLFPVNRIQFSILIIILYSTLYDRISSWFVEGSPPCKQVWIYRFGQDGTRCSQRNEGTF